MATNNSRSIGRNTYSELNPVAQEMIQLHGGPQKITGKWRKILGNVCTTTSTHSRTIANEFRGEIKHRQHLARFMFHVQTRRINKLIWIAKFMLTMSWAGNECNIIIFMRISVWYMWYKYIIYINIIMQKSINTNYVCLLRNAMQMMTNRDCSMCSYAMRWIRETTVEFVWGGKEGLRCQSSVELKTLT